MCADNLSVTTIGDGFEGDVGIQVYSTVDVYLDGETIELENFNNMNSGNGLILLKGD